MAENCQICGQLMQQVGEGIYACISCGVLGEGKKQVGQALPPREPKCRYCEDKGFVAYHVQKNGILNTFAARCFCNAGEKYPAFPLITQVFPITLDEQKEVG